MSYAEFLADEAATLHLGERAAKLLYAPSVVYLEGELGAGKTTFTRGLLRAKGYTGTVKSPTYAIVESYTLPESQIHHFDLYRFATPEEWVDAGLDELFASSLCLVEWAKQGGQYVPPADFICTFTTENNARRCYIRACHAHAEKELAQWQNL